MLLGSLLLHLLLGLLILVLVRLNPPPEALPPPAVAMVFESGSRQGPAAPQPQKGYDAGTTVPLPVSPPPAPQARPSPPPDAAPMPQPPASAPQVSEPVPDLPVPPLPPLPVVPPAVEATRPPASLPRLASPELRPTAPPAPHIPPRPLAHAAPRRDVRPPSPFSSPMNLSFGNGQPATPADSAQSSGFAYPSAREARGSSSRVGEDIEPIGGGDPGPDWRNALSAWIEAHKYYPREAALNGEDGTTVVRVVVDHTGRVQSVELNTRSGSQWLDLASQALFRGAHLPPFPPNASDPNFTFNLTMHYILIRR